MGESYDFSEGMAMTNQEALVELDLLTKRWQAAKVDMITAQDELDAEVRMAMEKGGPAPGRDLREKMMDYRNREWEARCALDEFISEKFG
jgi:hypothetical protein